MDPGLILLAFLALLVAFSWSGSAAAWAWAPPAAGPG